jgi:hypothetical protein
VHEREREARGEKRDERRENIGEGDRKHIGGGLEMGARRARA